MSDIERIPPQNLEAERGVLGAMLSEPEALDRGLEVLVPDAFYLAAHRKIFEAMRTLVDNNKPADLITLSEELERNGELESIGGRTFLSSLIHGVVTAGNLDYYADIVREKYILRGLIHAGSQISAMAYDESRDVEETLDSSEQMIYDISEKRLQGEFTAIRDILPDVFDKLEEIKRSKRAVTGIATGYKDLDMLTSGLHKSDYVILAARPSVGKTAFALSIALNVALNEQIPIALFSLEMAKEQLVIRLMASKFRVNAHQMRTGMLPSRDFKKIGSMLNILSNAPIYIDDSPNLTVLDMRAKTRRIMRRKEVGLIIVDYLQLITSGQKRIESRQQEITMISRQLKALGRELRVPVMALSQLSRQVEARQDKRPVLADLRESGAIEQDADVVMFIYRPELHKIKTIQIGKNEYPSEGIAEIIVAKQRNGPVGSMYLKFNKESVTFDNLVLEDLPTYISEEEEFDPTKLEYGGEKIR